MWDTTVIGGRPAAVYQPGSGPFSAAVIYLHGYGGESLQEHSAFTDVLERVHLPVVCPQGGHSWWLDVPSPEFGSGQTPLSYVRDVVTAWIADRWGIAPPRIGLLGVTMGGQGVLNLSYRHAQTFPVAAALSPALDFHLIHGRGFGVEELFDSAESARQETAVLHLHPLNWPRHQFFCSDPLDQIWHDGSLRLASKLRSSGIPFECDLETSHGGHGWSYFDAMAEKAVTFLAENLNRL